MPESRSCIFCQIVQGKILAAEVMRQSNVLVIMDKYPITKGHSLVIPAKHYDNLLNMPIEEVTALYSLVPTVARAIVSAVKADGFNVGQNNGYAANQIVPHVHVHIVPRFESDTPDGRWPSRTVARQDDLARIAAEIREQMTLGRADR